MGRTKQLLLAILPTAACLFGAVEASAQAGAVAPDGQFGIGFNVSNAGGGVSAQYAFSPSIHAGVGLGLVSASQEDVASATQISIGPYLRVLLEGPINPFLQAGVNIGSNSVDPEGPTESVTESRTNLYLAFGLEYFATRNIGIFAAVTLLDMDLSRSQSSGGVSVDEPKETAIGIGRTHVGLEYFFAR